LLQPTPRTYLSALFAVLCLGAAAHAGDYHDLGTLNCAECHRMHFRGEAASFQTELRDPGPLLKRDINELCLACHDGSRRAADVVGLNQGSGQGSIRQAGYLNRVGHGNEATGHTLGSTAIAPGSNPAWSAELENGAGVGLTCVNCHSPHGSRDGGGRTYRNLRSDAGHNPLGRGAVTYNHESVGTNDPTRDVFVRRSLEYDEAEVDFNEPDRSDSAIARFCAGCHDLFHGVPGDSNVGGRRTGGGFSEFIRHPSSGVDIGALGGERSSLATFAAKSNRVKVQSSSGTWSSPASDASPTCISCHKAHGNGNPFGLIYRSGNGQPTEDGDTGGRSVEALCGQCHATSNGFLP
jgi:hypothetical protein